MERPFNLVLIFSVTSFIAILVGTIALSWLLGTRIEDRLLVRDRVLVSAHIQEEVDEYLPASSPFTDLFRPNIWSEIEEELFALPGSRSLEVLDPSGKILWATDSQRIGIQNSSSFVTQVLFEKSGLEQRIEKNETLLYVPILRQEEVIGIFVLHRVNSDIGRQVATLKHEVYGYCALFGILLYGLLMGIVVPAARVIRKQHGKLTETAITLQGINIQLKEMQRELLQKERLSAIGEVCGAVAHGLKNPISSVRSAVQLLGARTLPSEERLEITEDILEEVDRLTKRLNDLLNFIRPFELNRQYYQLTDILRNAVRTLQWKAKEEAITVEMELPEEVASLPIDASLVEEAVLIVLSNAMDASSPGHTINCHLTSSEEQQVLTIVDQGRGIAPDILPYVFDCFFTTRSQGVGLGLALCKKIIELHLGQVTIESQENMGTTVQIIFPKHPVLPKAASDIQTAQQAEL